MSQRATLREKDKGEERCERGAMAAHLGPTTWENAFDYTLGTCDACGERVGIGALPIEERLLAGEPPPAPIPDLPDLAADERRAVMADVERKAQRLSVEADHARQVALHERMLAAREEKLARIRALPRIDATAACAGGHHCSHPKEGIVETGCLRALPVKALVCCCCGHTTAVPSE